LSAARIELSNIDRELITARSALTALRGQMSATPANLPIPGLGGAMGGSPVAALEGQLAQYKARGWTDSHPDVVVIKGQIERLREQGGGDTSAYNQPNPAYTSLRAMVAEKEAQVAAASARKAEIEQGMAQIASLQSSESGVAGEQARLNRDQEVLRRQYEELLAKREQVSLRSDVQAKTDAINFRIIDPPSQPTVPAAPNRPLLLTIILIVAVGGGVGAAFAQAQLQPTFATQGQLEEATGLPVLGSVREVFTAERRALHRQRLKWFAGAGGALAASYAVLMLVEFWQRSTVA
jgi:polysaccharide chain length determinant protein (PEP-CTERM system associated)